MRTLLLLLACSAYALAVDSPAIHDALLLKVRAKATAFDAQGNLYLAGTSVPPDVPNLVSIGPARNADGLFIVKIAASRKSVLYAAKIGGSGTNAFGAFAVDAAGDAYLAGSSSTTDFPATTGAFVPQAAAGSSFVAKLDSTGKLVYATYLDQSEKTQIRALAASSAGSLYAAGSTDGLTFPTSAQSYQRSAPAGVKRDTDTLGFIAQLKADGSGLFSSTLLGGAPDTFRGMKDEIRAIAIGPDGTVHVGGNISSIGFPVTSGSICTTTCTNSFLAQFDASTSSLLYSEVLGGSNLIGIAMDGQGNIWAAQNAAQTMFVQGRDAHHSPSRVPTFSGYHAEAVSIFTRPNGHLVLSGTSQSCNFPTRDAIMPCPANQPYPAARGPYGFFSSTGFVMEFDGETLVMSTPIGGVSDSGVYAAAADPKGGILVHGSTQDTTFPDGEAIMGPVEAPSAFTFRIDTSGLQHGKPTPTSVVNAMSFAPAPLASGSFATLFGSGLGPTKGESFVLTSDQRVPTEVAGVQVTVAGVPAPVLYAQDTQINIAVPQSVSGSGDVCVIRGSDRTCVFSYIQTYDPGVFRFWPGGSYAIFNEDGTLNSSINPAPRGSYITVWGAGFGPYTRSFADGAVTDLPLAYLAQPVTAYFHDPREMCVGIGGTCLRFSPMNGEVPFAGAAPFAVSGLTQINIKVPQMEVPGTSRLDILNNQGALARLVVSFK